MLTESKLNSSFEDSQFHIPGYFEKTVAKLKVVYVLHKPRFNCKNSNELQVSKKSRGFTSKNNIR